VPWEHQGQYNRQQKHHQLTICKGYHPQRKWQVADVHSMPVIEKFILQLDRLMYGSNFNQMLIFIS
jgi:hypothetical protein